MYNDLDLKKATINRRDFLKVSTAAGGGLLISLLIPKTALSLSPAEALLNPLLKISEDNTVRIILSKVEMGQGVWTTLPMLLAEELDCNWKKIKVEPSPPGEKNDFSDSAFKSTGGSESTKSEFDHYRMIGATARVMLVSAAAKNMGVSPENCKTEDGYVLAGDKKVSYGEVATAASLLEIPSVKLREPGEWKYIGKSQKRLDAPQKVNGSAVYGMDIQFHGLLTAMVAHPPTFGGTVKSFDASGAKKIVGVREVVQIPSGVAVIADHFWAAKMGREALKIEWDVEKIDKVDSKTILQQYSRLSETEGAIFHQKGNVGDALAKAEKVIQAEFQFPFLAHAPMEPLNCTVKISADKCEVWTGTQSPLPHQAQIANFLGLRPEQVLLHTPYLGGSFGRRGTFSGDWIMEAVNIAKVSGKFIKLVWSREDDIQGGYYRPIYLHNVRVGVDRNGLPVAWQHTIVGQSLFTGSPLEELIVHKGIDYSSVTTAAPYSDLIPDFSFSLHTTKINVPVSAWRSVGSTHTAYVVETLIDALAASASIDPVEYRRTLLKNSPRHLAALNLAAEKAKWNEPLKAGRFRGVAVCEAMGSYVAQVAEISVGDGKVTVHRVVCAIDCGLAVNPDGVRAQMESGIIFGLTAVLYGEITLEQGKVKQHNFNDYRMLRISETPQIEVHIVPSKEKMGGAGEPGVAPIAPAVANALFAATGKLIHRLPLQPEDLVRSK